MRPITPSTPRYWWRPLLVLALIGLAVPAVLALRPSESPRTVQAGAPVEALLVGDSVMAAMTLSYGATARQVLAARHTYLLDAKGCRRLITTSCSIGSSPPPTNAITVITAYAGTYNRALVVAAGYNDSTTGSTGLSTAIDRILTEAKRQGVPYVVWLTYREAGSLAARFHAHNVLLRQQAALHPELRIADWATRSAGLPSSWFSADGVHLGPSAATEMADLIADTLDLLPPPTPPTTSTTTTTNPCRLVDTTVTAPTAPPPSSTVAVIGEPAEMPVTPQTAGRTQLYCNPTTT